MGSIEPGPYLPGLPGTGARQWETDRVKIFRHDGIYLPRFWWWYPWHLTRWWMPKIWKGSDEWCNVPLCFTVPPFGCFLVFQFWRPMRTEPCPECSALELGDGRMTA